MDDNDLVERLKDHGLYSKSERMALFKEAYTEIERLRKGIQDYLDGNYASPRDGRTISPQTKCPHGMFYWDACENCIDEHFSALLKNELSLRASDPISAQVVLSK